MIPGLVHILLWQGAGELVSHFILPHIPGPVIGLVLLLGFLALRGPVPDSMALVSDAFSQHLGLLFVPAATGVILFLPQLRQHAWAVVLALFSSVILTIAVTAVVLKVTSPGGDSE
ncbi:MAG: CidA/LrgA family protein [Betaproteobacteria bacterium]|nr:CidA/LrgA family protein [Betaproteobacteria bacterium]